jgi:hypothetical protein
MDYEENNRYVHDYEDDGQPIPSTKIGYDNTSSGLDATNVQGAIDEVTQILNEKQDKTYDGTESGIEADTVTGAIDELAQDMSDLTDIIKNSVIKRNDAITTTLNTAMEDIRLHLIDVLQTLEDTQFIILEYVNINGTVVSNNMLHFFQGGSNATINSTYFMSSSVVAHANDITINSARSGIQGMLKCVIDANGATFSHITDTTEITASVSYLIVGN